MPDIETYQPVAEWARNVALLDHYTSALPFDANIADAERWPRHALAKISEADGLLAKVLGRENVRKLGMTFHDRDLEKEFQEFCRSQILGLCSDIQGGRAGEDAYRRVRKPKLIGQIVLRGSEQATDEQLEPLVVAGRTQRMQLGKILVSRNMVVGEHLRRCCDEQAGIIESDTRAMLCDFEVWLRNGGTAASDAEAVVLEFDRRRAKE